ncbi:MAG: ABC transporter ATP-binding protein [Xanthomonadales bacterium]|nr:Vitamin B12 import ATP-binding protein BtuD [Xanthomonadales bacterium]MCC6593036.1 ABC transporter ATP-binding protein [Xanthomonadales bacterium]MCE7931077.1 ABC transporter ATP-binding protein [Xanthomonadales bacterium PRO6]
MIEIKNLTKRYGDLLAVDSISFTVAPGEVLGFLGPNGAGKSTTMKMIAGFLTPSDGSISVCGFDVEKQPLEAKRCIGYLPEGAPAWGEMTPAGFLSFIADIRGIAPGVREKRIREVVARLGLERVFEQPIETLSKGFKRRVGIAQAILHDPKVLVLDEPTDGLDPNQKHEVRTLIQGLAKDKIVIVSTHILEEVHAVCTRAIIIAAGKVVADATPDDLEARSRYHGAVTVRADDLDAMKASLAKVGGVDEVLVDLEDKVVTAFPCKGQAIFGPITRLIQDQKLPVHEVLLERGRLDEVFRTITQTGARS